MGSEDKNYIIWMEGYAATGQAAGASVYGQVIASSFEEACDKLGELDSYYDSKHKSVWGCKLFDNEAAARASYG